MKPEETQELLEFVDNLAKGCTENKGCTFLTGKTAIEVHADKLNEFDDFLDDRISKMVKDAIFAQKGEEYEQTKRNAMQLFLYTFAKTFEAFYQHFAQVLQNNYQLVAETQIRHNNSVPTLYVRHLAHKVNAISLRAAWSVTCWDMRAISIARDMAEVMNREILHKDLPEVACLKTKSIGYVAE